MAFWGTELGVESYWSVPFSQSDPFLFLNEKVSNAVLPPTDKGSRDWLVRVQTAVDLEDLMVSEISMVVIYSWQSE